MALILEMGQNFGTSQNGIHTNNFGQRECLIAMSNEINQ